VPESWEVASDEEWEELQRGILKMFGTGPAFMQRAIGQVLKVVPPVDRIRRVEQKLQPKVKKPPVVEETPYEKRRRLGQVPQVPTTGIFPWTEAGQAHQVKLGQVLAEAHPEWTEEQLGSTVQELTFPAGAQAAMMTPGLLGLPGASVAGMFGGQILLGTMGKAVERAGFNPRIDIGPVTLGPSGVGQIIGAVGGGALPTLWPKVEQAVVRSVGAVREAAPVMRRTLAEETGGLKPRVPEEPIPKPAAPPTEPPAAPPEDPVTKLTTLIKAARKTRPEAEALKHEARVVQAGELGQIWQAQEGELGAIKARGALKGELPKPKFEPVRPALSQDEIDGLYNRVASHAFKVRGQPSVFAPINAQEGLTKLLNGQLPTMGQIQGLEQVFGKEFATAARSRLSLGSRAWREAWEISGLMRGVQAAFDLSYGLRQGIVAAPRHPTAWLNMWKEGFKQVAPFWGEAQATERLAYWEAERVAGNIPQNLFIAEWGPSASFTQREETFISGLIDKVPGIRMSNRAFSGMGNELRGRISQGVVNNWRRQGIEITDKMMEDLGKAQNYLSGRGPIPDNLGQVLSGIFYAPRFVTSKPAWVTLLLNPSTTSQVRWLIAQELAAFVGTGLGVLSAVKLSGVGDVELNPDSSDFGKIRVGNLRIDFWGGTQQMARYTAQLITGQRKTIGTGEMVSALRQDVAGRFVQSKLSPQAGVALDIWRGETYMGEDISATPGSIKTQVWNRMAPMFVQDVVDAVRMQTSTAGIAAPLSFLGAGVQTMVTPGETVNRLTRRYDAQGRGLQDMAPVEFDRLVAEHPDLAAARDEEIKSAAAWGNKWAVTQMELQQGATDFQDQFLTRYRDPQGMKMVDFSNALSDFFQKRAMQNEVRYKDVKFDPRSPLAKKLDEFYGGKELSLVATPAERDAFFNRQNQMLAADPELAQAVKDNQQLTFRDPTMRAIVAEWQAAKDIRKEYYDIPRFTRLSVEDGELVQDILNEAADMVQLGKAVNQKAAIRTIYKEGRLTTKEYGVAMNANRLGVRNRQRAIFWKEHGDVLQWFGEIPPE